MKKIVPDPPAPLGNTAETAFGASPSDHAPFFLVRAGIPAEDALVHASLLLRGIYDTLQHACSEPEDPARKSLLWASLHSTEIAKVLIDAVLDGIQPRKVMA